MGTAQPCHTAFMYTCRPEGDRQATRQATPLRRPPAPLPHQAMKGAGHPGPQREGGHNGEALGRADFLAGVPGWEGGWTGGCSGGAGRGAPGSSYKHGLGGGEAPATGPLRRARSPRHDSAWPGEVADCWLRPHYVPRAASCSGTSGPAPPVPGIQQTLRWGQRVGCGGLMWRRPGRRV